jgi:uncharacterized protein YraI
VKRVLLSILIVGGVVYAIHTWPLPNTRRLFGDGEKQVGEARSERTMLMPHGEGQQTDRLTPPVDANSPHAITVEDASAQTQSTLERRELASSASQSTTPNVDGRQIELVKIASRASIQAGPSTSTPIIGIAHPGADAQVISRNSEWAQIIDPGSKKTGWVHSRFLEPQNQVGSTPGQVEAALDQADEAATTPSARPKTSSKSKRSGKHGWKRNRHKRGLALRFRLRRFF